MIEVLGVSKHFGSHAAVDRFDLTVPAGARVALLGPSGCGKTTVLRMIAGLETLDSGVVRIGGAEVGSPGASIAPHLRGLGFVFQDGALFPHLTVIANVAYGLSGDRRTVRAKAEEALDAVGLAGYGRRMPADLSGGEQRRVALARALAPAPARLLLDEPLTNLDAGSREVLLRHIDAAVTASGASLLYVSHDHAEASALGCDVVRMEAGRRVD